MPPKKRGRKPKKNKEEKKGPPKKRGRKPKGGKIIKNNEIKKKNTEFKPNIILHLKTNNDINNNNKNITAIEYNPEIHEPEAFNINHNKINILQYEVDKLVLWSKMIVDLRGKVCM